MRQDRLGTHIGKSTQKIPPVFKLQVHNLAFLDRADHIVALEDQAISEQGTFPELMANGKGFSEMMEEFASKQQEEEGDGEVRRYADTENEPLFVCTFYCVCTEPVLVYHDRFHQNVAPIDGCWLLVVFRRQLPVAARSVALTRRSRALRAAALGPGRRATAR